jgi:DNA-binding MarR family transcriptional regulator
VISRQTFLGYPERGEEGQLTEFTDAYSRASKTFRAVTDVALRRHGVHLGQNLLLDALAGQDGQTPGELAAAIRVTVPTVVKMSTRMAAAGLIDRRRDAKDNRLVRLYLTRAGRALLEPVSRELEEIDRRTTAALTRTERRTLIKLLNRVSAESEALQLEWTGGTMDGPAC